MHGVETSAATANSDTMAAKQERMIDHWFPCATVDAAVGTPAGSGRNEKAIFPWFASRPIAQARAAVLTALLPADNDLRSHIEAAVRTGSPAAFDYLSACVLENYGGRAPVVVDIFSGRGIVPLEAARVGATAVGTDLSPVATLAGRLLADWAMRDWSSETALPFADAGPTNLGLHAGDRLVTDARLLHGEIGRRTRDALAEYYPANPDGRRPWGYLWTVSMPCDQCRRRFPLIGSFALRHPYRRTNDSGQSMRLILDGDAWRVEVVEGPTGTKPTYASAGKKGKSARCPFCNHVHSLETVKAKGFAGQCEDEPLLAADFAPNDDTKKVFRVLRADERDAALSADPGMLPKRGRLSPIPDEAVPPGNVHTIQASGYGYTNYGDLMCARQTLLFGTLAHHIRTCHSELLDSGLSPDYAHALASFASATLVRGLRYATRGAMLRPHGKPDGSGQNRVQVGDIFRNEARLSFQFDFFEAGIGEGPGTWAGLTETGMTPLAAHLRGRRAEPARLRRANAMALPFRDATVDAVVTDPPYYDMIEYADASDYFYVWLRRALIEIQPDLFAELLGTEVAPDLQNKDDEIIVRRVYNGGVRHDREFYERSLSRAFREAKRILRADGHLVVVFGHSDPDAWLRLLGALRDAGFVVTSSWPSRTETSNTGVASIKVTVTIGCRVASTNRPVATAAQVDREVATTVKAAVRHWDADGLALTDQLMAAYGPAMEVYGRYSAILKPDGSNAELDRYLNLARAAVRDATALKLDELPLETFDAPTRFAVFWQRLYGRTDVPKGEARFLAQADNLRLEDLRGQLLTESKSGFKLRHDAPGAVGERSSTFEVVRAMAAAWDTGATEAVSAVIGHAQRLPTDQHLWAVVGEILGQLPASDPVAKALTAVQRNAATIASLVQRVSAQESANGAQMALPILDTKGM
jgi:adenine-specific DNA methylase